MSSSSQTLSPQCVVDHCSDTVKPIRDITQDILYNLKRHAFSQEQLEILLACITCAYEDMCDAFTDTQEDFQERVEEISSTVHQMIQCLRSLSEDLAQIVDKYNTQDREIVFTHIFHPHSLSTEVDV